MSLKMVKQRCYETRLALPPFNGDCTGFLKEHLDLKLLMGWWVLLYLSDEWSAQRASGETLLDLMPKIMHKNMNINIPVKSVRLAAGQACQ